VIQALSESAIDYILKPVKPDELRNAIDWFKKKHKPARQQVQSPKSPPAEIIALQTSTGMRFTYKNSIIMFNWNCGGNFEKKCWTGLFTDRSEVKLKSGSSATDILGNMGQTEFIRISPSVILNIGYIAAIDYATRECQLLPPFNDIRVTVSRSNLAEIRDKFDIL
jgi:two-component system LytT family response regulator